MSRDIVDQIERLHERPQPVLTPDQSVRLLIAMDVQPAVNALRRMVSKLGGIMTRHQRTFHLMSVAYLPPRDRRKHQIRCDTCNPRANPPPLPRAGRGYHQRLQARRRRGVKRG